MDMGGERITQFSLILAQSEKGACSINQHGVIGDHKGLVPPLKHLVD